MTRKVQVAVMAYGGDIPVPQAANIALVVHKMTHERQWNSSFSFRVGDSILPRARNACVAEFLAQPDTTDLLMVDADTMCSPEDMIKLIEIDEDVVGAPYRTRNEPLVWASIRWLPQDVEPDAKGLIEVECLGTGMIKFTRKALERLWETEAEREYEDVTCKTGKSRPLFWFEVSDGHLWGEDMIFCRKWRALGGKCFAAPHLSTGHFGKQMFNGNLAEWLKEQPKDMIVDDAVDKSKTHIINKFSAAWLGTNLPVATLVAPPPHLHVPVLNARPRLISGVGA